MSRQQTDIRYANHRHAVTAFRAHRAGGSLQADEVRCFAIGEIAAELPIFNDVGALRRDSLVVVGEGSKARTVVQPRVGDDVHDIRGVTKLVELIERKKAGPGEIGFLTENAVEFEGMANRFVNLQTKLAGAEDDGAGFFRTLRGRMQRGGFLRDS